MGRTNPTHRDQLDRFEDEWQGYRRSLRRRYQRDFDALFEHARQFAHASSFQNPTDPDLAVLVSILLAQEVEHRELAQDVAALRDMIEDSDDATTD